MRTQLYIKMNEWLNTIYQPTNGEAVAYKKGFEAGQSYASEETARKIWDAGVEYGQFSIHGGSPAPPDFDTFYKQLIEGK